MVTSDWFHLNQIELYKQTIDKMPVHIYWKNINFYYTCCNFLQAKEMGLHSPEQIIGKTDYDFFPKDLADLIRQNDIMVISENRPRLFEEKGMDKKNRPVFYLTQKIPLQNNDGEIVGLAGISFNITTRMMSEKQTRIEKERAEATLANISNNLPGHIYWKDMNSVYQGCNSFQAKSVGLSEQSDIIGKTDFDMPWRDNAEDIRKVDLSVIKTKDTLTKEEIWHHGEKNQDLVFLSTKAPLFDKNGDVTGILGISLDITDRKKLEQELEEAKEVKMQLQVQEQFTKMANQVAHDIRSPLASLLMIVKACEAIPERERIALRSASTRISDIANNLLNQYKLEKPDSSFETEEKTPILLSATLLQLLTEKKFQYQDCPVEFNCQFEPAGQFAFISIEPSSFKRMISNLINNAVDAFAGKPGVITLKIDATNEWANVVVADNGQGMSTALIEKIMNNMSVTEGKVDGNGIGLTQVRETLARNDGTLSIHSKIGRGTAVQLKFPRIKAPVWIAEEITLGRQDIVVILDDDHSIHGAWDSRFEFILKQAPDIQLHHFETGDEALGFIKTLTNNAKKNTLLLTDFELLKQTMNGLDVVESTNLARSILVTSHYDNPGIQKRAHELGTKILPKQLASEIPMSFHDTETALLSHPGHGDTGVNEKVHAILVDDDVTFIKTVLCYCFDDNDVIAHFTSPEELKENLIKYPEKYLKNTKICLDNNFNNSTVKGVALAQELHDKGYTQLYLVSGDTFRPGELPEFLTVLEKGDIKNIKDW